jgi:hypothetical protein
VNDRMISGSRTKAREHHREHSRVLSGRCSLRDRCVELCSAMGVRGSNLSRDGLVRQPFMDFEVRPV